MQVSQYRKILEKYTLSPENDDHIKMLKQWEAEDKRQTLIIMIISVGVILLIGLILTLSVQQFFPKQEPVELSSQIFELKEALDGVDGFANQLEEIEAEALALEQRIVDAEALLALSENDLQALDRRLKQGEIQRNLLWAVLGGAIGIALENALKLIRIILFGKRN